MHPELDRIRNDLAKARQRVADIRSGAQGTQSASAWSEATSTKLSMNNGGAQWANQLKAREADITRLESEYVQAMLSAPRGGWSPAAVIAAMEHGK